MLEQRRRAGAVNSSQSAIARSTALRGRKGACAVCIVDVEVTFVPVATMGPQPSLLKDCMSARMGRLGIGIAHRDWADEEAARGKVEMFGGSMLLWSGLLASRGSFRRGRSLSKLTRRCAV